jgi:hypothetical protein
MGRGFPIVGSTKHKLKTWSSTEHEIVRADDFSSRSQGPRQNFVSGQQEFHASQEKQESFEQLTHKEAC